MSYQVLARKWRPKSFAELVGQEHVVTVLTNALAQQRLHHAYLFTGTRGVGKTTIARIFAKSLNCEQGISATPCGICSACVDIDDGRYIDLLEVDAASRTKVDDTREILDNVQYAPSRGKFKVYLIDEVHMLSRSSFNALLKTLEEPPAHVKFILATTDPQKLPVTVLSRCLQFHLRALSRSQIESKLHSILDAEKVTYQSGSLSLLAKSAQGSMRDGLSLTDQAIAQGRGHITLENLQSMLGGIDQHWVYQILTVLLKKDASQLMSLSLDVASYTPNYTKLLAELLQLLHQIALYQLVPTKLDIADEYAKQIAQFAQVMTPEDVQLFYQIVLNGRKDLPYCFDEQAGFDMVLMRLLAFCPIDNVEQLPDVASFPVKPQSIIAKAKSNEIEKEAESVEPNSQADSDIQTDDVETQILPLAKQANESEQTTDGSFNSIDEGLANNTLFDESIESTHTSSFEQVDAEDALANPTVFSTNVVNEQLNENLVSQTEQSVENVLNDKPDSTEAAKTILPEQPALPLTGVQSVLATRNMLRSKKKQLEEKAKKPKPDVKSTKLNLASSPKRSDISAELTPAEILIQQAEQKQSPQGSSVENQLAELPDIDAVTKDNLSADKFDPLVIKKANQVDKWANMIDQMALGGRLRQLAIHAEVDASSTESYVRLNLKQEFAHLRTESALKQLQEQLSALSNTNLETEITIVDSVAETPYQIQHEINDKRASWAKELIYQDDNVQKFLVDYDATIDDDSIKPT